MKPIVRAAVGLAVSAQCAFASQGPGVTAGRAGLVAQASAQAIIGAFAAVVIFGIAKGVFEGIRRR